MERLARDLPAGFGFDWTGLSFEEKQASGQIVVADGRVARRRVPAARRAVRELGGAARRCCSSCRSACSARCCSRCSAASSADVYFNVGLITIIGLAAKNAILIVEFAIEEEAHGKSTIDATLAAVKLRLRPIIMTSLAFVLGMVPLRRRARRRRGEPHRGRHRRRGRHARRHGVRHLLHPAVLSRGAPLGEPQAAAARRGDRASARSGHDHRPVAT